jgi:hypothetical protein
MNDGKLWLQNVKPVVGKNQQIADPMVGTSLQVFV